MQLESRQRRLYLDGRAPAESPTQRLGLEALHADEADPTQRFAGAARAVDVQLHGLHGVERRTAGQQRWQRGVSQHHADQEL